MDVQPALALPNGIEVRGIKVIDTVLTIRAVSTQTCPCCPLCGTPASRVHSRYTQRLTDLPCGGQQVCMQIQVRKCFCEVSTCARKIFVERLTAFVDVFARVTRRLYQMVQVLGLATGGRLGVRLTDRLGIQTSRQTILRRIMALPTDPVGQVVELGIDDFSFRRGRRFGTILVNVQTRQVIDVLADRKAETSA
ncbi:MAG: transposase family protein, partial [Chloroflexota bacterium]|nr:transposase family protein [Chloroflexota bacterium]